MAEEDILKSKDGESALEKARKLLTGEKEASKALELPRVMKLVEKMTAPAAAPAAPTAPAILISPQQPLLPRPSRELQELPMIEVKKSSSSKISSRTILILMGFVGALILILAAYLVFLLIG